jgi:predicted N-acetyltransferase YhbS
MRDSATTTDVRQAPSIIIRPLEPTDSISRLTELLHRAYRPLAEKGMKYVASYQGDDITAARCAKGDTFVCELDQNLVGTITLSTVENTSGSPWYDRSDVASFGQFAVEPTIQKLGIGSKMMQVVEDRAAALGIVEIALDTSERATNLIEYYTLRGYRFIEYVQWDVTNYRSVILSKTLGHSV